MHSAAIQSKFRLVALRFEQWGQNGLPHRHTGKPRFSMALKCAVLGGVLAASLVCPPLVMAQGTVKLAARAPGQKQAEIAIRAAILARKFKGGDVRELMLSEPEHAGNGYRYHGEFTVNHGGKTIHCEDWRFVLLEKLNGWIADETTPGRCND